MISSGLMYHLLVQSVALVQVLYIWIEKINNHIHHKVWDEIAYPFLNFNGATVEF